MLSGGGGCQVVGGRQSQEEFRVTAYLSQTGRPLPPGGRGEAVSGGDEGTGLEEEAGAVLPERASHEGKWEFLIL